MRNKVIFLILVTVMTSIGSVKAITVPGSDTCWLRKGQAGVNLSQVSLSSWSAGGDNSIGLDAFLNYSADFKKGKNIWNNRFEFAYGLNRTETDGTKKTNDKIYYSSTYGYNIAKNLYWSTSLTFNTQFDKGWKYDKTNPKEMISRFMSPGYLSAGTGITWTPKKWFVLSFNPVNWKMTYVGSDYLLNGFGTHQDGAFGVDWDKNTKHECGANLKAEVKYDIMKNINLFTRLELFSNYLDQPQNIDVTWDVILSMKINKWFSANITTNMIYDNDIKILREDTAKTPQKRPHLQFKEALGIGFTVNF